MSSEQLLHTNFEFTPVISFDLDTQNTIMNNNELHEMSSAILPPG